MNTQGLGRKAPVGSPTPGDGAGSCFSLKFWCLADMRPSHTTQALHYRTVLIPSAQDPREVRAEPEQPGSRAHSPKERDPYIIILAPRFTEGRPMCATAESQKLMLSVCRKCKPVA